MTIRWINSCTGSADVLRPAAVLLFALATLAIGGPALCQTTIFDAARNGDLASVQTLLKGNPDLAKARTNDAGFVGVTALMLAAQAGHIDCVNALIAAGADVNARKNDANNDANNSGWTALIMAASGGHADCVKALIAAGADVNAKKGYGGTALGAAAAQGYVDCVAALIAAGADVNAKNSAGHTALIMATRAGHADCVAALEAASSALKPRLMTLVYPCPDYAIAQAVVTDPAFGAVPDGKTDCTAAVQAAIDAVGSTGGGVVFLPAGRYLFAGNLDLPEGVALRGDWKQPDDDVANVSVGGTVLMPTAGRGQADGAPFITLHCGACVRNLSVWYPDRSASDIAPYPWTVETPGGPGMDCFTVENVTLVNSYQGLDFGGAENRESPFVRNVYGTPLKVGLSVNFNGDPGRAAEIRFSDQYWLRSGLGQRPDQSALDSWLQGNATGIAFFRTDGQFLYDIAIRGYQAAIHLSENKWGCSYGLAYGVTIDDCGAGLLVDAGNSQTGWQFANCSINVHGTVLAIGQMFQSTVQFNGCHLISDSGQAVDSSGAGLVQLENCDIGGSIYMRNQGTLEVLGCRMPRPDSRIELAPLVTRALIVGTVPSSRVDSRGDGDVQVDASPMTTASLDGAPPLALPPDPRPAKGLVFDVRDYGAAGDGQTDDTAAFQKALDAAGAAGGGTVFAPASIYRFSGSIEVPTGVELRGSFDSQHHTMSKGTVLFPVGGRGDDATPGSRQRPFISLDAHSGVRGLTVYYPDQRVDNVVPYPWSIQSTGPGCWLLDVTGSNAYRFVDFGDYPSDGSLIRDVNGGPIKVGIYVSKGSCEIDNVQFNPHFWMRQFKGAPPLSDTVTNTRDLLNGTWKILTANLDGIVVGDCPRILMVDNFVVVDLHALRFVSDNGQAASGWVICHQSDMSAVGCEVDAVGPGGLKFPNIQLVHASDNGGPKSLYVAASSAGDTTFFNGLTWGLAGDRVISLDGSGKTVLQCWSLQQGGVEAGGGELTPQGIVCRPATPGDVVGGLGVNRLAATACATAGDRFSILGDANAVERDDSGPIEPLPLNDRFTSASSPAANRITGSFPAGQSNLSVVAGAGQNGAAADVFAANLPAGVSHSFAVARLYDNLGIVVKPDTMFRYWIKPDNLISRQSEVELELTDGSKLADSNGSDTMGRNLYASHGRGVPGQWNLVQTMIGTIESGKTIKAIEFIYDDFRGDSGPANVAIARIEIGEPR